MLDADSSETKIGTGARTFSSPREHTFAQNNIAQQSSETFKDLGRTNCIFSRRSCLSISDEYGRRLSNTKIRRSRKKWRNLLDFEHPNGKSSNRAGPLKAPGQGQGAQIFPNFPRRTFALWQVPKTARGVRPGEKIAQHSHPPPIPFSACRKSACGTGRRRTI